MWIVDWWKIVPDIKLVRGVEKFSEKVMEVKIGINNDKSKFEIRFNWGKKKWYYHGMCEILIVNTICTWCIWACRDVGALIT